jgi:hypothetical protein
MNARIPIWPKAINPISKIRNPKFEIRNPKCFPFVVKERLTSAAAVGAGTCFCQAYVFFLEFVFQIAIFTTIA